MKTTWNYSRRLLPFFLCMLLSVFGNNAQTLPFRLSKGAGTFRLGVVAKDRHQHTEKERKSPPALIPCGFHS